ncbi:kinase-like domain-containing protein [Schizothecium vesticola]|uniref:non-specific serine/threonine protein kinase n=1 Tax=Schizothecium vesticola TaxID=314040 RepID=A0AA40ERE2_9PEZI|nr:kinase-like domain-containing protein [Schizothecium vesticola]
MTRRRGDAAYDLDVEEGSFSYRPGGFHPVYVGDVFNRGKYLVLNKIGYGENSTVWMVQDLSRSPRDALRYLALKVLAAGHQGDSIPERDILVRLGTQPSVNPRVYDGGHQHIRHLVDDFEHTGPNGTHVCLVFELMGETLERFHLNFTPANIPMPLMRKFTAQLVLALGWAHSLGITHADIHPGHIFVKFQTPSRIAYGYLAEVRAPRQNRSERRYTPIRSSPLYNYYFNRFAPDGKYDFDICLGGWGHAARNTDRRRRTMQPTPFQSPEVLIEAPWDKRTDWWSLGATLIEIHAQNRRLFHSVGETEEDGRRNYLAQIEQLCGPFSQSLLSKGNPEIVKKMFDDAGQVAGAEQWEARPLRRGIL